MRHQTDFKGPGFTVGDLKSLSVSNFSCVIDETEILPLESTILCLC